MDFCSIECTTTVDIQTLLKAFSNMSQRTACFIDEALLVKCKASGLGTTVLKCQIISISELKMSD